MSDKPMTPLGAEERVEDYAPITNESVCCTKCGLEAKMLLHRFCTHRICPVRAHFGGKQPTGMIGEPIVKD